MNQDTQEGPCIIDTLLISDSLLPSDRFYETGSRSSYDPPAKIGIEKIGTAFSSENAGGIVHNVYRFNTEKEAQDEIEQIIKFEFVNTSDIEWFSAPITPNISADNAKLACTALSQNGVRCRFVAQYRVYVSDLFVDLIAFNYEDLRLIIEQLNKNMMACFTS